ncbi:aspartate/glutamate racemase family protein [Terasakiella sp. A23]|uniref:aspartate/glutamate racemase family protein n=1 Tax=Terasakiella sp. FCG-A23 TaxID=3080561 RepID=UPI002953A50D|nr:aspartate/glutamate racemase family protein [Terasakiella sp. A23]MDV7338393.1 aspartate/glutamate racemase family protein [Terasakiella sp. A23]
MKCIGMLGGMSWESTQSYYKGLNKGVKDRLGGLHSARISLHSVDFAEIEKLQHAGDWDKTAKILTEAAVGVEKSGADFLMICTNTMHKVAPAIEEALTIPLLHIADATGQKLKEDGIKRVGLLGTKFTMEQDFYKGYLTQHHGIEVMVPDEAQREWVHQIIYDELCLGEIKEDSRKLYLAIIEDMAEEGCEAVILGCTEIALLVQQDQTDVPLYDTTQIHVEKAIDWALDNG